MDDLFEDDFQDEDLIDWEVEQVMAIFKALEYQDQLEQELKQERKK